MASFKHCPNRPATTAWRVYCRGKSYYVGSEADAKRKVEQLEGGRAAFSPRELEEYRHAKQLLGGYPLIAAVRHYMERQSGETDTTVADTITAHAAAQAGRPEYLKKKTYYLGKLAKDCGSRRIADVTPRDIEAARMAFRSEWMKNDFLKHVRILFRYAARMKITRNDPTDGMTERKVTPSKVILSLADAEHMLATCAAEYPRILPAVAFQLLSGIRTSEVCRLQWSAVRVGEFIDISPDVAKTHERRVIDYWPARLTQFMPAKREGGVVALPKAYEHDKFELVRACRLTKPDFKFGQNAPRHSFASYAVARFQDAGKVALLMGQRDVNILFRHYRNYCTEPDGFAYFGEVMPVNARSAKGQ